jgi:xanthine dehydrogenase YagS FAD-binding subunit
VAADARLRVQGGDGIREMTLEDFYVEPGDTPWRETMLEDGELIVEVIVPPVLGGGRSVYLKLRERASYEFALASVAAAVEVDGGEIRSARLALGGVATRPWRCREAEQLLAGVSLDDEDALTRAGAALAGARPLRENGYKIELSRRAVVRALRAAGGQS